MSEQVTRRGFLQASAAGGCLLATRIGNAASAAPRAEGLNRAPLLTPIIVVTQPVSRDVHARSGAWTYIYEILQRAGLFFRSVSPEGLAAAVHTSRPIVILAGDLSLTSSQREAMTHFVRSGGALIGMGGTSGLDEVFGIGGQRPLAEGWMKLTTPDHPITANLRSSLHFFGGCATQPTSGTSLAEIESGSQGAKGSILVEHRFGKGRAVLLAADLLFSIVHIQQGLKVFQDGKAAPDGSAATDDGLLKAEDGLVLDWRRDRKPRPPDDIAVFLESVSDELREIILRSVFHLAVEQDAVLPMLWYWPRGLKAVGHISHDTDGNDPKRAVALLELLKQCNVRSTWCVLYPGGYPRDFYHDLRDRGFEIGLHYDARSGRAGTSWSKDDLFRQHAWLRREAGLKRVTTNKNHYLRWEGRLDFLRWCEELGIACDQTRGGSKPGTIGFPLGGSQPYFPIDDEAETPRMLDVFEINMLTQDWGIYCPVECGRRLLDAAIRHHGVAHFLFHPHEIVAPGVADALRGLIEQSASRGIEWWTSEQIRQWEVSRRGVKASFRLGGQLTLRADAPVDDATLLFLRPRRREQSLVINGRPAASTPWRIYGFQFDAATVALTGDVTIGIA